MNVHNGHALVVCFAFAGQMKSGARPLLVIYHQALKESKLDTANHGTAVCI